MHLKEVLELSSYSSSSVRGQPSATTILETIGNPSLSTHDIPRDVIRPNRRGRSRMYTTSALIINNEAEAVCPGEFTFTGARGRISSGGRKHESECRMRAHTETQLL